GRQLAQLVVDQRPELAGRVRVALLDGGQEARDIAHARKYSGQGSVHPACAKRPGWSRSHAAKVARRHLGGGGGMSALELFPDSPRLPERARRSDAPTCVVYELGIRFSYCQRPRLGPSARASESAARIRRP